MAEIGSKLQRALVSHFHKDEKENKERKKLHEKIVEKLASKKADELNKDGSKKHPQGSANYFMVRSKIAKGPDSYGKVVSKEREQMMQELGYDPGKDVVPEHLTDGQHKNKKGDPFKIGTRSHNTADSNRNRSKKK